MTSYIFMLMCPFIFTKVSSLNSEMDKNFGGPYEMNFWKVEHCEDSGTDQFSFHSERVNSYNRSVHIYTTNFTLKIPLTIDISVEVEASRWGNGGWRPRYLHEEYPSICEGIKLYLPTTYENTKTVFGVQDCPYPVGTYTLPPVVLEHWRFSLLPIYPYGKYRSTMKLKKQETVLGCTKIYYDVVPRRVMKKKG